MESITLPRPDDWHVHLRWGDILAATIGHVATRFARALVMPNLVPPIRDVAMASIYRQHILSCLEKEHHFEPLMALYLCDDTRPEEIIEAKAAKEVLAYKLYPAGVTTHSEAGIAQLESIYSLCEVMEKIGMSLCIHGEVNDPTVDIFDRERVFIERHLAPLLEHFPGLKIVLEHITTIEAVDFVTEGPESLGATITAHHLLLNRNDLLAGGIRPHHYCLPIVKRERHRQALLKAATSGNPKFFLGTDSAPHLRQHKESACGCAGIYTAHAAIEFTAEAFDSANALEKLAGFTSQFGADFYGLPRNTQTCTLERKPQAIPKTILCGNETLIPFRSGLSTKFSLSFPASTT